MSERVYWRVIAVHYPSEGFIVYQTKHSDRVIEATNLLEIANAVIGPFTIRLTPIYPLFKQDGLRRFFKLTRQEELPAQTVYLGDIREEWVPA